jgi:hypothetical protein
MAQKPMLRAEVRSGNARALRKHCDDRFDFSMKNRDCLEVVPFLYVLYLRIVNRTMFIRRVRNVLT